MPYTTTNWTDGTTPVSAANMNHLETQYTEAVHSIEQDLFGAHVASGLVASKDSTVASQLNITPGVAFVLQADGSLRRWGLAGTDYGTSVASTTYYLDLNPDGSYAWATTHSTQANYLPIAQVTTDASGNIASVTDNRTTLTNLLASVIASKVLEWWTGANGSFIALGDDGANIYVKPNAPDNAARNLIYRAVQANNTPIDVLTMFSNGQVNIHQSIQAVAGQVTAGSFGVPVIVAQALNQHVTGTGSVGVVTFTPPTDGLYRFSGSLTLNNGTSGQKPAAWAYYTDPNTAASIFSYLQAVAGQVTVFSGNNTVANGAYPFPSIVAYCKAGLQIGINYQDGAGTPNDYISAIIERLS